MVCLPLGWSVESCLQSIVELGPNSSPSPPGHLWDLPSKWSSLGQEMLLSPLELLLPLCAIPWKVPMGMMTGQPPLHPMLLDSGLQVFRVWPTLSGGSSRARTHTEKRKFHKTALTLTTHSDLYFILLSCFF